MASPTIVHSNINALLQSKSFDPRKDANVKALDDEQRYQLMEHLDCAHPTPFQSFVKAVASYFTGKKDLDRYQERHKTLKGMDKFEVNIVNCLMSDPKSDPKKASAGNDSSFLRRVGEFFGHYISNDALIERLVKSKEMLTSTTDQTAQDALDPTLTAYKQYKARSEDCIAILDELNSKKLKDADNQLASFDDIIQDMNIAATTGEDALRVFFNTPVNSSNMKDELIKELVKLNQEIKKQENLPSDIKKDLLAFTLNFQRALESISIDKMMKDGNYSHQKVSQALNLYKVYGDLADKIQTEANAPYTEKAKAKMKKLEARHTDTKTQIERFSAKS